MAKVAFLGTGVMGREMALRLIKAGHAVAVYNRTAERTRPLAAAGARAAATPAEAAAGAEIVISMVGDDAASRAVWLGPDGALAGLSIANALAVESATLSRAWVLDLAAAADRRGFDFLDCPVTGGPDGARDGRLTLLVGGAPATLDRAWPVLKAYAGRALHFGPVGAGTAYKTMVNLMGAVQAAALAEGLLTAERAGLDLKTVAEALASGAVASPLVKYLVERMTAGNHDDVYFAARWRLKDARYGLALAADVGQATPVSALATELFRLAVARGWGDKNSSVVIETLR
jgi:3-hydroxyisobutyrate dehydrogenase